MYCKVAYPDVENHRDYSKQKSEIRDYAIFHYDCDDLDANVNFVHFSCKSDHN